MRAAVPGRGETEQAQERAMVYCVVPVRLALKLHDVLRRHFGDEPGIEVVVESRSRDRRRSTERRDDTVSREDDERRRIRSATGRRMGDRRAAVVEVESPGQLPRAARPHRNELVFIERIEPTGQHAEDLDSARLVTRFQSGDETAFATLYMRYFDRIYSYLRVALTSPADAEDACQQVFTEIFEALPRYERRKQPFRAWLFVIARNSAIDHLRKHGRIELADADEINRRRDRGAEDDGRLQALDWISDRELLLFIERLPLQQRQVLVLRYMLDLKVNEVAEIMGTTPNHVSVLQHRALGFLRERLAALGRTARDECAPRYRRRVPQAQVLRTRRFVLLR
jgi:RNA polymerase sigma-70 factor (ECF subfamily)